MDNKRGDPGFLISQNSRISPVEGRASSLLRLCHFACMLSFLLRMMASKWLRFLRETRSF